MKVLHLFSNAKWTGPAEPALNLCVALRRLGVEADFACAPNAGKSINKIVETARDRGIEPILKFGLRKHKNPLVDWADVRALRKFLRENPYDLIHCHLDNDHRIARATKAGIPIVRSSYYGEGAPARGDFGKVLASADLILQPSRLALEHDANAFKIPHDKMRVVPGAVDTERFDPARVLPDGRRRMNVPQDAFVVGIVARMQTHRRYEDFWQAMRHLAEANPQLHVIVIGRGTKQDRVAFEPVRALGLGDRVHFTGYLDGEDYVGMLKAFDVKVFLVPGSDGTCRAVREALAMGKPVVAADRGMLREIVDHEQTGYIFDGTAEALHNALAPLIGDRPLLRRMSRNAREKAVKVFSLEAQSQAIREHYRQIVG
ncbi:MAG: glycosyltransferase family 4 protein [FCB group bacterium]|jgi:glycosyltransferase involved in cell wall biosynthesis|nr:glycosyltransferase family 4 protein [FCB group bacterium]